MYTHCTHTVHTLYAHSLFYSLHSGRPGLPNMFTLARPDVSSEKKQYL